MSGALNPIKRRTISRFLSRVKPRNIYRYVPAPGIPAEILTILRAFRSFVLEGCLFVESSCIPHAVLGILIFRVCRPSLFYDCLLVIIDVPVVFHASTKLRSQHNYSCCRSVPYLCDRANELPRGPLRIIGAFLLVRLALLFE